MIGVDVRLSLYFLSSFIVNFRCTPARRPFLFHLIPLRSLDEDDDIYKSSNCNMYSHLLSFLTLLFVNLSHCFVSASAPLYCPAM